MRFSSRRKLKVSLMKQTITSAYCKPRNNERDSLRTRKSSFDGSSFLHQHADGTIRVWCNLWTLPAKEKVFRLVAVKLFC
ncbi:hypothetical protein TNCT_32871 [Trichonephila clavata]|uniref:Uncharacterized protein n=1 Tax=Trichonephila clavata TaxID=2740835 RepID=A0A8X6GLJ8_TRICU|nr:hypothetical protein TNCT_32871 [Trichonephila clavata]